MYLSHPVHRDLACTLLRVEAKVLSDLALVYTNIWMKPRYIDLFKAAYLVEWLRRNRRSNETVVVALTRALDNGKKPGDLACATYAATMHQAALHALDIDLQIDIDQAAAAAV